MKYFLKFFSIMVLSFMIASPAGAVEVNDKFNMSGFILLSLEDNDSDDFDEKRPNFGGTAHLVFDFHPNKNIQALLDLEFDGFPAAEEGEVHGELEVERAFLDFRHSDPINLKVGQFFAPYGLWMPVHWEALVPSKEAPIFFTNRDHFIGSNVLLGVDFHGQYDLSGDLSVAYHLSVNRGKQAHGAEDEHADGEFDSFGYDVRFHYTDMLTLGVSYIDNSASEDSDPAEDPEFDVESDTFAIYGRVNLMDGDLVISSEYFSSSPEGKFAATGEPLRDLYAGYVGVQYTFLEDFDIYYRYDRGHDIEGADGDGELTTEPNPLSTGNLLALNYRPFIGTRLWVEYHNHHFSDPAFGDSQEWSLNFSQLF